MNTFNKSVVSLAAFTGSFGAVGSAVSAETNYPGDGDYTVRDLSDSERDMLVKQGLLTCSVKPEIRDALGIVTLQEEFSERGYNRSGIDGIDGNKFCQDTYKIQVDNNLYADGVVGNQMVGFFGGLPSLLKEHGLQLDSSSDNSSVSNTSETCEDVKLTRWVASNLPGSDGDLALDNGLESRTIQDALNKNGVNVGFADGIKGKRTLDGVAKFQGKKFDKVDCLIGSQTFNELGITATSLETFTNSIKNFDPKVDCPRPSSCDIQIDLSTQRMSIINTMGVTIWNIPIQSGKLGKESRAGRGKLGPVEYGPGQNPRRQSIDYPEATLVNPRSIGNGGQKIHGSDFFSANAINSPSKGSAGCYRVLNENSFVIAKMPTGTDVIVTGAKPGTKQRYF